MTPPKTQRCPLSGHLGRRLASGRARRYGWHEGQRTTCSSSACWGRSMWSRTAGPCAWRPSAAGAAGDPPPAPPPGRLERAPHRGALGRAAARATAPKTLQGYISHLRKVLGSEVLLTRGGGYLLAAEPEALDAERFESLAAEARDRLDNGDAKEARERLGSALACGVASRWRTSRMSRSRRQRSRRKDERLSALEDRIEADLALGRERAMVGELETLVDQHPNRERLLAQLMLALYRSGRQADALSAYREPDDRRCRTARAGAGPGVARAGTADPGSGPRRSRRPARRRRSQPDASRPRARPARCGRDRPARRGGRGGRLRRQRRRRGETAGGAQLRCGDRHGERQSRLGDRRRRRARRCGGRRRRGVGRKRGRRNGVSRRPRRRRRAADDQSRKGPGRRRRWRRGRLGRERRRGDHLTHQRCDERGRPADPGRQRADQRRVGDGVVWVTNSVDGTLSRIDPASGRVAEPLPAVAGASGVAIGFGRVWVVSSSAGEVVSMDPGSGEVLEHVAVGPTQPRSQRAPGQCGWRIAATTPCGGSIRNLPHTPAP